MGDANFRNCSIELLPSSVKVGASQSYINFPVSTDSLGECRLVARDTLGNLQAVPGARLITSSHGALVWEVVYHGVICLNQDSSSNTITQELSFNGGTSTSPSIPILQYNSYQGGGMKNGHSVQMTVDNTQIYLSPRDSETPELPSPLTMSARISQESSSVNNTPAKITLKYRGADLSSSYLEVNFMIVLGITTGQVMSGGHLGATSLNYLPTLLSTDHRIGNRNTLSFGSRGTNSVDILLFNDVPIYGFQFTIQGPISITSLVAGRSKHLSSVTFGGNGVLGFDLSGSSIPQGDTRLITVVYKGSGLCCLTNVQLSSSGGGVLNTEVGECVSL